MAEIERERRALQLFEAMLEIDAGARERWLAEHAGDDPQLRGRVTQLHDAHCNNAIRTGGAIEEAAIEEPPERIGAYRLEGLIGSGGMGSVYAARRDRGDFEHEVAIKLIKPGLLSEQLTERFGRERQLLASFSHPNIARLYDGGETDDGLPFIVMEKVEGIPLGDWIDQTRPSLPERLALFLKVCDAVSYAHGHLVVHRDLTPSNILVELTNEPKLIDFGIAQPDGTERRDADGGAPLVLRHLTLTPGYAAPERLRGETATTLSDIYSAGRLLNFLVPKPRPAELQAIANKATASETDDRYQSIEALAADVRRHLENRPVAAMPPSSRYRFAKFIKRNPAASSLSLVLAAAVILGLGATSWNWIEAERAREEAQQRFDDVRGIANFMLFDLYEELQRRPGNTATLHRIADEAQTYLVRLRNGAMSPDLRLEIARGYHRLSDINGGPSSENLGRTQEARQAMDLALEDLDALANEFPLRRDVKLSLAGALYSDAVLSFIGEDDNERALASSRRSAAIYQKLLEYSADQPQVRLAWYRSRLQAARALPWLDRPGEGIAELDRLHNDVTAYAKPRATDWEALAVLATISSEIGNAYVWEYAIDDPRYMVGLNHADLAISRYTRLIEIAPRVERPLLREQKLSALYRRSLILGDLERWPAALADLRQAERIANEAIASDPDDMEAVSKRETVHSQMIYALLGVGNTTAAIDLARSLYEVRAERALGDPNNASLASEAANVRLALADALLEAGRRDNACGVYRRALKDWRTIDSRWPLNEQQRANNITHAENALLRC
ncbi:serine/threonine protein kinase [Erythrobacter litoralis HTCC2594]|uniref:Serine/threonine protein kinase n=2 Tax=Erythrobacter litoralis TaxID=39960 RepID=Q2N5E2_ERYLH|nr:serine/threonine protein kinase [Erythrobacter litoralis HTCC2594]